MSDRGDDAQRGAPGFVDPESWIGQLVGPSGFQGVSSQMFLSSLQEITRALKANTQSNIFGQNSALNLTAAAVIKTSSGRLRKLVIIAPGSTSGAFSFNDCTTVGAAAAANLVYSLPFGSTQNVAGAILSIDLPFKTGIVLSAVPGGGSPICAVSFD